MGGYCLLFGWLVGRLGEQSVDLSVQWLFSRPVNRLVGWSVGWSVGRLVGWSVGP